MKKETEDSKRRYLSDDYRLTELRGKINMGGIHVRYVELNDEIDLEWVELILEALQIGLTKEEILNFFKSANDS
ncbi:anti-repressor SinI family protein [Fervidibacillus halotolerans]|uniref:Anti-repressor SinI family protein n=1 Tax=Fervidibacillus halotolerans TaxID=2980027 RepID=A0A9E8LZV3_9BACI|nr:anti-repressor SinI family protein [Fervidibacillus halotolerans]WAA12775.1 anti-repressor SinI family protein [Fervidibacillus halotolerans]